MIRRAFVGVFAVVLMVAALAAHAAGAEKAPININTATAAELTTIQGIGPAKAQSIIDYREKNGTFKTVEDLKLVRGIGDKMLEQLRPQVTIGGSPAGNTKEAPAKAAPQEAAR
jgi:competence protein ComEA